jgi:hypothetical protein
MKITFDMDAGMALLKDRKDEKDGPRSPGRGEPDDSGALRCHCGSLIARRVEGGVELKCRRCKRTVVLPLVVEEGACARD